MGRGGKMVGLKVEVKFSDFVKGVWRERFVVLCKI